MVKIQKKEGTKKRNFSRITKNIFILFGLLFLLGFGTAFIIIDPMKYVIQFEDNIAVPEITNEVPEAFPERVLMPNNSLATISTIIIGQNNTQKQLYTKIAYDLQIAIFNRTNVLIPIQNDTNLSSLTNNSIVIGNNQTNNFSTDLLNLTIFVPPANWSSGSFFIRGINNLSNSFQHVLIYGNDSQGDCNAVYWLIDQIMFGEEYNGDLFSVDFTTTPEVKLRMVDAHSVFLDPNIPYRKDFSEQIDIEDEPYANETLLMDALERFEPFIDYVLSTGYNALQIGEFHHLINYDFVENGTVVPNYDIYSNNSKFRQRHTLYQEYFSQVFEYAEEMGIDTYIYTRIPWFTPALEQSYPTMSIETIIQLYELAIDEFFTYFPNVDGLMVITGEIGGSHNLEDYYGRVVFDSIAKTQKLLQRLLDALAKHNKTLIYRIWSIGIGSMGDIHRNPTLYHSLLDQFDDRKNLVISLKFQAGDYYRYLPFNPNFEEGNLPQMVEVEGNLEYGGMGVYPNYIGELFQEFMQSLVRPTYGMWAWIHEGAAPKEEGVVGPETVFLSKGFWSNTDANINAFGKIAWNRTKDINNITFSWTMKQFGYNHQFNSNFTKMLLSSDDADYKALYISDFARKNPSHLGGLPTPQHWIYWDVPQGSSFALAPIYKACKEGRGIDANIQEGFEAVAIALSMEQLILSVAPNKNNELFTLWKKSVKYGKLFFNLLANYRQTFLYYYKYSDTLNQTTRKLYQSSIGELITTKKDYVTAFKNESSDLFPLADLSEMNQFILNVQNSFPTKIVSLIIFAFLFLYSITSVIYAYTKKERISRYKMRQLMRKKQKEPTFVLEDKIDESDKIGDLEIDFEDTRLVTQFKNSLTLVALLLTQPRKLYAILQIRSTRYRIIFLSIFTLLIFSLDALCLAIYNFFNYGWQIYLIILGYLIVYFFFNAGVKLVLMRYSIRKKKNLQFLSMLEITIIAIGIPMLYRDIALLSFVGIFNSQKLWLLWIDPIIVIFLLYCYVIYYISQVLLSSQLQKQTGLITTNEGILHQLLIDLTYVAITTLNFVILQLDFWNDIMAFLHEIFMIFFSTMFERGPGAGAWISVDLTIIILIESGMILFLVLIYVTNYFIKKRKGILPR